MIKSRHFVQIGCCYEEEQLIREEDGTHIHNTILAFETIK